MKKCLCMILSLLMVLSILSGCGGSSESSTSNSSNTDTNETTSAPVSTPTPEPTEPPKEEKVSDYDIITREGHPTYYGSVEQSHKIWDDVEKGKIHFADSLDKSDDTTILSMSCYRKSDVIRGVLVSFEKFAEPQSLTIDDVLGLISSYMPYEVMDKYYEFFRSEVIVPDESRKDEAKYYVITYHLTDEGKAAYNSKEHDYSGTIDVIITEKDNVISDFDITFGTPRWMSSLDKNSYHKEEWVCNLYDYR